MKYTGQLVTGDFEDNTMTFMIDGEMILQAGKYEITKIEAESKVKNLGIANVSGMLKHRSGVKGVFIKSFYPTGKPLTTIIETDKGYYYAPSNEFVDA